MSTLTSQRVLFTAYPQLIEEATQAQREAAGLYAYAGLEIISERLKDETVHYRNANGLLLTTLDEVVRALLDNELVTGEASKVGPMPAEHYRRILRTIYIAHNQRARLRKLKKHLPGG